MTSFAPKGPEFDEEKAMATMAAILMARGAAREVALLAFGRLFLEEHENDFGQTCYDLKLRVPPALYGRLSKDEVRRAESALEEVAQEARVQQPDGWLRTVSLVPALDVVPQAWRDGTIRWLRGEGITNQGRVRSDSIAARECDGLLFRSQPEINLYTALKARGVAFAPLPVFVRGGETYQRIERDFVIYDEGVLLVVEVDGDTVHTETPAEADQRLRIFKYEGATIERVPASECDTEEKARAYAARLVRLLDKLKRNR